MEERPPRTIIHAGHRHELELSFCLETDIASLCSGCELRLGTGWIYRCRPCNYSLHFICARARPLIDHPSHPYYNHALALCIFPVRRQHFICNACNAPITQFYYHCRVHGCNFNLHLLCTMLPLSVDDQAHHHTLHLNFQNSSFECNKCHNRSSNAWRYHCRMCDFNVYPACVRLRDR